MAISDAQARPCWVVHLARFSCLFLPKLTVFYLEIIKKEMLSFLLVLRPLVLHEIPDRPRIKSGASVSQGFGTDKPLASLIMPYLLPPKS